MAYLEKIADDLSSLTVLEAADLAKISNEQIKKNKFVLVRNSIQKQLIHEKMCIAIPPRELIELFLQYDEHVTVYQILRQMEIYDKFPIQYGTPYPGTLMQKIEERIKYLNMQHHKYSKCLS